jgi:predicted dehydrogenase
MKIIAVGSGSFAQKHARIFQGMDDCTVCAFVSRSRERALAAAAALARDTGASVAAYDDLPTALDEQQPDAAVIAVTPDGHGPVELALIERGIPFIVEKPIGIDSEIPESIANALEKSGVIAAAAFHMRYLDTVELLGRRLAEVHPVMVNGFWMGTLPPPAWWRHMSESGGQFNEQSVHVTDLIRHLFGEVDAVTAMTSSSAIESVYPDADVPDAGAAVLRMKSGITATILNSCVGPAGTRTGLEIVSREALFSFDQPRLIERTETTTIETRRNVDPYKLEDEAFVRAVRDDDVSGICSTYADALKTHRVSVAIAESARTGSTVHL